MNWHILIVSPIQYNTFFPIHFHKVIFVYLYILDLNDIASKKNNSDTRRSTRVQTYANIEKFAGTFDF